MSENVEDIKNLQAYNNCEEWKQIQEHILNQIVQSKDYIQEFYQKEQPTKICKTSHNITQKNIEIYENILGMIHDVRAYTLQKTIREIVSMKKEMFYILRDENGVSRDTIRYSEVDIARISINAYTQIHSMVDLLIDEKYGQRDVYKENEDTIY